MDCISREAAIDAVNRYGSLWKKYSDSMSLEEIGAMALNTRNESIKQILEKLPSVNPERKKGKWFLLDECANEGWYCDQCHKKVFKIDFSNTMKKYKFCPNCGAEMEVNK